MMAYFGKDCQFWCEACPKCKDVGIDFAGLENQRQRFEETSEARGIALVEQANGIISRVKSAEEALRRAGAECGVSDEAKSFHEESNFHKRASTRWLAMTILMTILVGVYGVSTFFLHQWLGIDLKNTG